MANLRRRLIEKLKDSEVDNNYRVVKKSIIADLSNKAYSKDQLIARAVKLTKQSKDDVENIVEDFIKSAFNGKSNLKVNIAKIYKSKEYYKLKK